jgi:hypothetical protein|tara:strand:- start:337 stop:603 length:267 start_codon:yes stop_codon:yes gene_type:complete
MKKTLYKSSTIDIEIDGVYLDVEYDYKSAEPMVYNYGDGSGYPGCAAEVHIYKVTAGGKEDIMPLLADYVLEEIEGTIHKIYDENYEN